MAITGVPPGVRASIVVNGNALPEYEDRDIHEDERTITRYVEAVSDQTFETQVVLPQQFRFDGNALIASTFVDGKWAQSPLIYSGYPGTETVVRGYRSSSNTIRKFRFVDIQRNEAQLTQIALDLGKVGTVEIKIYHVNTTAQSTYESTHASSSSTTNPLGAVSEKALKGQATLHSVGFSEPVKIGPTTYWKYAKYDPGGRPFITFVFRYRSREALKAMLIIPRTPSPEPEAQPEPKADEEALENRDVTTMTPNEIRELQRRAREARESREEKTKIKQEEQPGSPRRRKTRRSGEVLTIELDDDGEVVKETTTSVTPEHDSGIEIQD